MDRYLGHPLFREVAPLRVFPMANQVLMKQAGYRDLFRTFVLGEFGSRLALDLDVDDIFSASQRNAAALYEYWAFLQLADAVGVVCGSRKTVEILQPATNGLSIGFSQGWRVASRGVSSGRAASLRLTCSSIAPSWCRPPTTSSLVDARDETGLLLAHSASKSDAETHRSS